MRKIIAQDWINEITDKSKIVSMGRSSFSGTVNES